MLTGKAEEFLKERGFEWMDFSSRRQFLLIRDLMEAYANQKVLEALRKEIPKAYDKGNNDVSRWHNAKTVGKKYYKTEVEPKYKK